MFLVAFAKPLLSRVDESPLIYSKHLQTSCVTNLNKGFRGLKQNDSELLMSEFLFLSELTY